jgi:hypothetical protein
MTYDRSRTTLIISITDVTNLPHLPITSTSSAATHVAAPSGHGRYSRLDPYVRLGLMLPDGRRFKAKTRVVRASTVVGHGYTVAPRVEFGETFAFRGVDAAQLTGGGARLHLAALAFDRFSRDAIIGDCTVSFDDPQLAEAVGGSSCGGGESATARSRRGSRGMGGGGGGGGHLTVTVNKELTMNPVGGRLIPRELRPAVGRSCLHRREEDLVREPR